jgi:hypothetical protein
VDKRAKRANPLVLFSTVLRRPRWVGAGRRVDYGGGGGSIEHADTVFHRVVHASLQSLSPGDRVETKLTRSRRCAFVAAPKRRRERIHEAHLPTQSHPAPAHPRLPRADELTGRPTCDCTTTSQGPPPAGAYYLQEVAFPRKCPARPPRPGRGGCVGACVARISCESASWDSASVRAISLSWLWSAGPPKADSASRDCRPGRRGSGSRSRVASERRCGAIESSDSSGSGSGARRRGCKEVGKATTWS